jgi:hypothetical protein
MNILLHPMQKLPLIEKTRVQVAILFNFLAGKKTMNPDSVVERDNYHVVASSSNQTTSIRVRICVGIQPAALDPNKDWMSLCFVNRGKDVEKKTVLSLTRVICGRRRGVANWCALQTVSDYS